MVYGGLTGELFPMAVAAELALREWPERQWERVLADDSWELQHQRATQLLGWALSHAEDAPDPQGRVWRWEWPRYGTVRTLVVVREMLIVFVWCGCVGGSRARTAPGAAGAADQARGVAAGGTDAGARGTARTAPERVCVEASRPGVRSPGRSRGASTAHASLFGVCGMCLWDSVEAHGRGGDGA